MPGFVQSRFPRRISLVLACMIVAGMAYYFLFFDWKGKPACHKQVQGALLNWMEDRKTNAFPNVNGSSVESLAEIDEFMGSKWRSNYRYVPGLRADDPEYLVLMYIASPTRWNWHVSRPSISAKKAWILVPVDFNSEMRSAEPGELSERVSRDEMKERLQQTLDFLKNNERPNWQAVIAEHSEFLGSLEQMD